MENWREVCVGVGISLGFLGCWLVSNYMFKVKDEDFERIAKKFGDRGAYYLANKYGLEPGYKLNRNGKKKNLNKSKKRK